MFNDSAAEITGFDSCPESEKLVKDNSTQTTSLDISNQGTQTPRTCSSGVQVSPDTTTSSPPYDANKLLTFLQRIMPDLEEELKTFDDLSVNGNVEDEETWEQTFMEDEKTREQTFKQTSIKPDFSKDKIISSLSWNSTGMMLAVGCSEKSHYGWCRHESSIGLYNTGRNHFEKQPEQVLKVSGCVKCLEFHESIPSLLAAGLHSGEVIIWDLKHDAEIFVMNKKSTGGESPLVDAVTTIKWMENKSSLWLVTAGRDGRIVLWKVNPVNLSFEVHERYIIPKQHLTMGASITEYLDVHEIAFLSTKCSIFLTATSGGVVFHCSLTAARSLAAIPYKDPVIKSYKPRKGIVTSLSCSSDMFASGGSDFEIQIFKYEQESPLLRIHTRNAVLGVCWYAPGSLLYWGESKVNRHVISSGKVIPVYEEGGISSAAVKTESLRQSVAVGVLTGEVTIVTDLVNKPHWV